MTPLCEGWDDRHKIDLLRKRKDIFYHYPWLEQIANWWGSPYRVCRRLAAVLPAWSEPPVSEPMNLRLALRIVKHIPKEL